MKNTILSRDPLSGVKAGMLGLTVASAVLMALSLTVMKTESGAVVAAIMLSGAIATWTSLTLYQWIKRSSTNRTAVISAVCNFAVILAALLFLVLNLL